MSTTKRFSRPVLLTHWAGGLNPKHAPPACGSKSHQVTARVDLVTCPKCMGRRDFITEALRGLDVTIGADLGGA